MDRQTEASRAAKVNLAGKMFFLSSHVLSALAVTALIPILPAIGATFHDTPNAPALTRALLSSMSLAMMVGSLCAGFLGERIGTRPVLFATLVVYAAAGGLGAFAPSLGLLLVSRVVLGLASSVAGTMVVALVAQTFAGAERDRGWVG